MQDTISIVIPTYNRVAWPCQALQSALRQTDPATEIFVIDGHSDAATEQVVRGFVDARLRYHRNTTNLGPARNLGKGCVWRGAALCYFWATMNSCCRTPWRGSGPGLVCIPNGTFVLPITTDARATVEAGWRTQRRKRLAEVSDEIGLAEEALNMGWFLGAAAYRTEYILPLWPQVIADGACLDVRLHLRLLLGGAQGGYLLESVRINTRASQPDSPR